MFRQTDVDGLESGVRYLEAEKFILVTPPKVTPEELRFLLTVLLTISRLIIFRTKMVAFSLLLSKPKIPNFRFLMFMPPITKNPNFTRP